nr:hypothetical protein [Tanacetum cinerariifolium]
MNRDHSEELLKDVAEARKMKKKRRDSPKMPLGSPPHQPPPPPPPAGPSRTSGLTGASGSSQVPPPPPPPPSINQEVHSSDDEDIRNAYIPKVNLRQDWWKPLEEDRRATPEPTWSISSSDVPVPKNKWASALASTYSPPLEDSPALSISKMKVAYYPDVGLEQMVPNQMWIEEECKHTSEGDHKAVRTHMRILSVVKMEVFSMYGYDHMKKIVLRRADLNEHIIAERDFKYLYPSDVEDLYGVQMIMRFNEIHKYSDGTLHQIDEVLDYRVKEFKINRMNSGLNTRFWTRKDVDRSKEFMFAIQKWLKTRRIFRNLESFIGGQVKDGHYRLLKRTE